MILGFMDPYVLACPDDIDSTEAVVEYVERICAWSELRREGWIEIVITRTAAEALADTNGFPPWKRVTEALARAETWIQPSDVFEVLNALLTKSSTIEDLVQATEILLDEVNYTPVYTNERHQRYRDEFERLLGMICLLSAGGIHPPGGRQLLTANAPCPHRIDFSGIVCEIQSAAQENPSVGVPAQVRDCIVGVCCPPVARREADYLFLWETAQMPSEFVSVINLYTHQQANMRQVAVPAWKIGERFVASIAGMQLRSRAIGERVLRACSETILGLNLEAVHAIRVSAGGGARQLRRGDDAAFRRDIDHELHLHYWGTSGGAELASVVAHNDLSIPE
jgi:hypothetical protein